jgi:hypothetical protein
MDNEKMPWLYGDGEVQATQIMLVEIWICSLCENGSVEVPILIGTRATVARAVQDGEQKAGAGREGNRRRHSDTFRLSSEFEPKRVSNGWSAC